MSSSHSIRGDKSVDNPILLGLDEIALIMNEIIQVLLFCHLMTIALNYLYKVRNPNYI